MKLEVLISIFMVLLLGLLSVVEQNVLLMLGCFAIGWQIPTISKAVANRFRNRNA